MTVYFHWFQFFFQFVFIGRMPLLVPIPDNADLLFTLVITPDLSLHHEEVADQDPASDSLFISRRIVFFTEEIYCIVYFSKDS